MDAPAIREELRVMCRKLSSNGYNVLLPNLFYREGIEGNYPFDQKTYKNSKVELRKMISVMDKTTNNMVLKDTKYIINYIKTKFENNKIGIVGYCMSGRFVITVGGTFIDDIKAIASFYGVGLFTEERDSPHLLVDKIKAELYLAFAEKDMWVPENILNKIKKFYKKDNTTIEVYPDTDHGFAFPQRNTYVKGAADKHWVKLLDLFNRNLL